MSSKSKSRPPRKKTAPNPIANLDLFEIPDLNDDAGDEDDSDIDEASLESQLEALLRGEEPPKRSKPKPKVVPPVLDIDKLAASCLMDDDEDHDSDDNNLSENEDLLRELQSLSPDADEECKEETPEDEASKNEKSDVISSSGSVVSELEERLNLYSEAVKMAKLTKDTSKARRYERAIKTLENLMKSAKSGIQISEDDIPPIVSIPKLPASATTDIPSKPILNMSESVTKSDDSKKEEILVDNKSSSVSVTGLNSNVNSLLIERREQYRFAALEAKKAGNKDLAIKFMRTAKTFDAVIAAAANDEPVDLTNIPPPPNYTNSNTEIGTQKRAFEQVQASSAMEIAALAAAKEEDSSEIFSAPPPPSSVLEALEQRLNKYTVTKEAAESEGNTSKARRLQRIVKQYEAAIKDLQAGKQVDFEELPTPPGFAPIPVPAAAPVVSDKATNDTKAAGTASAKPILSASEKGKAPHPPVKKPKVQRANTSASEKQLEFLLERQKLFREAALECKKNGDIQQAKEYLRMSKGFDNMIEATRCGLPIDATTIPTPPQLETDFVIVGVSDCEGQSDLTQEELFDNLEKDLCNQIELSNKNKEHFLRLGDVQSVSKYEKLALESKKDLSVIQHLKKTGENAAPKFHYETRLFSMVICNTDLSDSDLEVCIQRGINLPGKPDLDSFVKLELPIPSEAPQRAKTHTIRNTNNPEFGETFKFEINRKSRSQLRLFKRHGLKLEVWSRGSFCCSGFLRSDALLGTCMIKLVELESKCFLHGSYNLMDGRKTVPGMIEAKVKVREPLLVKQVEEVREKWLVIGS